MSPRSWGPWFETGIQIMKQLVIDIYPITSAQRHVHGSARIHGLLYPHAKYILRIIFVCAGTKTHNTYQMEIA